jgi:hypothetical protein
MSDSPVAIRAIALSEAVKHGSENIIGMANIFLDFLNGVGDTSTAAKPKAEKPAKAVKEPVIEKAKPVETAEGPTKVDVGTAVEKMLGANKRTEAVALMKKFGAASVSTLKETDYEAFIAAADAILMTA